MTHLVSTSITSNGAGTPVQILILLSLLTVIPGVLLAVTGFTRILVVLGFIRTGLGTPTAPPNQVLVGIAFFLTVFVMAPTLTQINAEKAQKAAEKAAQNAAAKAAAEREPMQLTAAE